MIYFEIGPRQDYAGYLPESETGEIDDLRIPIENRRITPVVKEYLGDPPRKSRKRGDLHKSAYSFCLRSEALELFRNSCKDKIRINATKIVGRESEQFFEIWVTNFVDCLDLQKTVSSPNRGPYRDKIGVIRRPVFDENRWDGSDLFVVPQDPNYCFFCTENFVKSWNEHKFHGAMFSRFLMDPEAILC